MTQCSGSCRNPRDRSTTSRAHNCDILKKEVDGVPSNCTQTHEHLKLSFRHRRSPAVLPGIVAIFAICGCTSGTRSRSVAYNRDVGPEALGTIDRCSSQPSFLTGTFGRVHEVTPPESDVTLCPCQSWTVTAFDAPPLTIQTSSSHAKGAY